MGPKLSVTQKTHFLFLDLFTELAFGPRQATEGQVGEGPLYEYNYGLP